LQLQQKRTLRKSAACCLTHEAQALPSLDGCALLGLRGLRPRPARHVCSVHHPWERKTGRNSRSLKMPRVKRGTKRHNRRKKLLGLAKGYYLNKSKLYKFAKESVEKALGYAYRDRKARKRDFRRLWIVRIGAAARQNGLNYNQFIS